MRLGHWSVLVFLISFSMNCYAAHKPKRVRNGHHSRPPAPSNISTGSQIPRSQSALDCTAHNGSQYIAINSTAYSPHNSPRARNQKSMRPLKNAETQKPQKTWWQRNRVNVAVGLSSATFAMLCVTGWYVNSAVNGAVAKVETQFAPVAQAAGEINAVYNFIQNMTGAGKP
jgi:hypothetical protein